MCLMQMRAAGRTFVLKQAHTRSAKRTVVAGIPPRHKRGVTIAVFLHVPLCQCLIRYNYPELKLDEIASMTRQL